MADPKRQSNKLHHIEKKDEWKFEQEGTYLNVMKVHEVPRTGLYLPGGEEEYLVHKSDIEAVRITSGVRACGNIFEIEDNWIRPGRGHRDLGESWIGSTTIAVKASARNKVKTDLIAAPKDHGPRLMPQPRVDQKCRMEFSQRWSLLAPTAVGAGPSAGRTL